MFWLSQWGAVDLIPFSGWWWEKRVSVCFPSVECGTLRHDCAGAWVSVCSSFSCLNLKNCFWASQRYLYHWHPSEDGTFCLSWVNQGSGQPCVGLAFAAVYSRCTRTSQKVLLPTGMWVTFWSKACACRGQCSLCSLWNEVEKSAVLNRTWIQCRPCIQQALLWRTCFRTGSSQAQWGLVLHFIFPLSSFGAVPRLHTHPPPQVSSQLRSFSLLLFILSGPLQ